MKLPSFVGGLLAALALLPFCGPVQGAPAAFTHWPAHTDPTEIGQRVAENILARPFEWQSDPKRQLVIYPEACAWYGALTFAELAKNADLRQRLIQRYDILRSGEGAAKISQRAHVDDRVFGIVPLEIARQTGDRYFLDAGVRLADAQWEKPGADGITHEARYWIDDMFMITALQVQAFRATHEAKYLDRAAVTMSSYLDRLQQPNGLFFHAPDSPFFWGRGNGWVAVGMAEILRDLPEAHPQRARIMAGYQKMMATLLAVQGPDGLWHQLLDQPAAWGESSCTGMFTFAFVTGVKHGWLDEKSYASAARKAWIAAVGLLDDQANLREVCVGTDKGSHVAGPDLAKQQEFYLARPRKTGDLHGEAPLLWTASAFLR